MGGIPETLYARDGNDYLAYQVVGDRGPVLLLVPGPTFPIDLIWDEPTVAGYLRPLASFTRLILTDYLGCGSSDAVPIKDNPAMQSWTHGLVAVLDAVGSEHASIFAVTGAGLPAMMLAASHPQRVHSLFLWNAFARFLSAPDQPFGLPEPTLPMFL